MTAWTAILDLVRGSFTAPGFACFTDLLTGWVLSPGRRTITRMLTVGDPEGRRAHDAYHRLVRTGQWSMSALWRVLATHIVAVLVPAGLVTVDCDDTLFHRDGRKVEGAGVFRDAVRSTVRKVVYARGLNLVVLTVRVRAPWGGCPLGLPVNMRLHRKGGATTVALASQMMTELAGWLPDRSFAMCADGAYASLPGADLPRTTLTSRLRRDAALYEPAPPRTGRRGRPAKKGARLPTPPQLAATATNWTAVEVEERGRTARRLIWFRQVLWYTVDPDHLVRLVIVRDPTRHPARRLLHQHRHDRLRRRDRLPLRRPLVDRGHLPRHQAAPRRRTTPILARRRTRTRRRALTLAAHRDLVLVSVQLRHPTQLDTPTLVPLQEPRQLSRRTRRTPQSALATPNYSHVRRR